MNVLGKVGKSGMRDFKPEFSDPQQMGRWQKSAGVRIRFSNVFAAISESLISLNAAWIHGNTRNYIWALVFDIIFFFG